MCEDVFVYQHYHHLLQDKPFFHFVDDVILVLDQPLVGQVISIPVQLVPGLPRGPVEVGLLDKVDSAGLGHGHL